MKEIGGYLSLEVDKKKEHFHKKAIKLNTGRNCFEYILRAKNYKKVYLPFYTCDVMLEPLNKLNIEYEFYHLDASLDPILPFDIKESEAILYTNYFGIKQNTVIELSKRHENLIIDNVQAFYSEPLYGIDTFYSARKFFGVSDGAYLYTDQILNLDLQQDISYNRFQHLIKRLDIGASLAYNDFKENDDSLIGEPIKTMSSLTETILESVDYDFIKDRRISNFIYLDKYLRESNLIKCELSSDSDVPMVYPFCTDKIDLKSFLIKNKVYIATYWKCVLAWVSPDSLEVSFVNNILPLPIDQRYTQNEMKKIIDLILK